MMTTLLTSKKCEEEGDISGQRDVVLLFNLVDCSFIVAIMSRICKQ